MTLNQEAVNGIANKTFSTWTAEKLLAEFEKNNAAIHGLALDYITLSLRGGIGNGKDRQHPPFYMTNKFVRDHVEKFPMYKTYLGSSLQVGANIYYIQVLIHHHTLKQYKKYEAESEWRETLDAQLKDATQGQIESIKQVFDAGIF